MTSDGEQSYVSTHGSPDGEGQGPGPTIARVMLRPIGSPLPLGFFAFALGTLVFSSYQVGVIPPSEITTLATLMLGAIFPLQLVSGVLAYAARDTAGATAISLLAGSWLGIGLTLLQSSPGQTSKSIGVFTLGLAGALAIFAALSLRGKVLLGVALALAAPRYALLGLFELLGTKSIQTASGILGFVLVAVATYGGIALLLEDLAQRSVWPIARRGVSRTSLEGDVSKQLERLANEAGVRAQL